MNKETNIQTNITTEEETKKLTKRDKLLIGVTVTFACAAGYFGVKCLKDAKIQDALVKSNKDLKDSVDTLMAADSEGVFEEALATVGRKIAYRKDKEAYLVEQLSSTPCDKQTQNALSCIRAELQVLLERQSKFIEAQKLYEIKDPAEI